MGTAYYYSRDAQRFGPVSVEQIRELAGSGQLLPTDLVWKEGMPDWVPAARLKGLFPVAATAAAQPVSASPPVAAAPQHADHADEFRVAELPPRPAEPVEPVHSAQDERAKAVESDQASEMARKAKEAALAAGTDALAAFKIMMKNPVGGLRPAFEQLGPDRALIVGIVFGVIFDLCYLIGERLKIGSAYAPLNDMLRGMGGRVPNLPAGLGETGVSFGTYVKLFFLGLVPPLCAIGGLAAGRAIFKGRGGFQSDVFSAGAAVFPYGVAVLVAGIIGLGNAELGSYLQAFGAALTVLILYSAFTKLQEIPEAAATLFVPSAVVVDQIASHLIARM